MSIAAPDGLITAEQFLVGPYPDQSELLAGRVVPYNLLGGTQSYACSEILMALHGWDPHHERGWTLGPCGYILARDPDTVRVPRMSWVANERIPHPIGDGYWELPPDLAVEVRSFLDTAALPIEKAGAWLSAGTQAVWLVWPDSKQIMVCRDDADPVHLKPGDTLTTEEVLPGFALSVEEVFSGW